MCCWTHTEHAYPSMALAENEHVRCQCTCKPPCPRRATQEDFRCDVCGGRVDLDTPPEPTVQALIDYKDRELVRYFTRDDGRTIKLPPRSYPKARPVE